MSFEVKLAVSVVCVDPVNKTCLIVHECQNDINVLNVPSGHVEPMEAPEHAAWRELREEVGLIPEEMLFAGTTYLQTANGVYCTFVYVCRKPEDQVMRFQDEDVFDASWMTITELRENQKQHRNDLIIDKFIMGAACFTDGGFKTPWHRPIMDNHNPPMQVK